MADCVLVDGSFGDTADGSVLSGIAQLNGDGVGGTHRAVGQLVSTASVARSGAVLRLVGAGWAP